MKFGADSLSHSNYQYEAQTEKVYPTYKQNTVRDFLMLEQENDRLKGELMEVQSQFTARDHEYLELVK
jgi:hypothetical protein